MTKLFCENILTVKSLLTISSIELGSSKAYLKIDSKPSFVSQKIFNKNLLADHKIKKILTLNKPAHVGMCVLDLS